MDYLIFALPIGYLLDLIFGDPRWLPHPVVGFGKIISIADRLLNKPRFARLGGAVTALLLPTLVFIFFMYLQKGVLWFSDIAEVAFVAIFVFFGLANRSLLGEGKAVIQELKLNGIEAGRQRLSWIVGRETDQLNEKQIYTAVFETLSENLSDGVIAPLFYYALGGIPAMMAYKMINTLDSMIGYKSEQYKVFGCFSAKIDDVVNYLPARITAFVMVLVMLSGRGFIFIFRYGRKHASPNAGFPESALAGILNCRFGGPNVYHGKLVDKPFIGEFDRDFTGRDFSNVAYVNHASTLLVVLIIFLSLLLASH